MGTGEAEGENRAISAAEAAISNPLLDEASMKGAAGVIINITGGTDLTLYEVDEAANHIRNQVDPDAEIIIGSAFSEDLDGRIRVAVVATGIGDPLPGQIHTEAPRVVDLWKPKAGQEESSTEPVSAADGRQDEQFDIEDAVDESDAEAPDIAAAVGDSVGHEIGFDEKEPDIDDAFLPSEPIEIDDTHELMGAADPFAEAAIENGTGDVVTGDMAPAPGKGTGANPQRLTLFEKVLSFKDVKIRKEIAEEIITEDEYEESEPLFESGSVIGALTADDRSVPPVIEDQLEIPAFLKRTTH